MVKRRTFKKSIKAAVSKAISRYHRRKYNFVTDLYWDNDNKVYFGGIEQNVLNLGETLSVNSGEFQRLGKEYAMVKLRGVLIEGCQAGVVNGYNHGVVLAHTNDPATFNNLVTQPNVMLLCRDAPTKMFFRVNGEFTSTNSIELFNNLSIMPFKQGGGATRFTLKITLYLTFKSNL